MAEESDEKREERANSSTSPKELEKLAQDESEWVRRNVAVNEKTPVSVLEKLAEDKDESVRSSVAENTNTPASVLEKLVDDFIKAGNLNFAKTGYRRRLEHVSSGKELNCVVDNVALNVNTPVPLLEKLAEDKDSFVRVCVAKNPNTPAPTLEKLVKDKDEYVRKFAKNNPNFPT